MTAASVIKTLERKISMTTVDLSHTAAIGLAGAHTFVAIAAQQPFRRGEIAAFITVTALLGRAAPDWVALPGLAVTAANVVEAFQTGWRSPAPHEVLRRLRLVGLNGSGQTTLEE